MYCCNRTGTVRYIYVLIYNRTVLYMYVSVRWISVDWNKKYGTVDIKERWITNESKNNIQYSTPKLVHRFLSHLIKILKKNIFIKFEKVFSHKINQESQIVMKELQMNINFMFK